MTSPAQNTDRPIRWGILGPGKIAHKFANGLQHAPGAELVAIGSRSQDNADRFADTFRVPRRHASYDALVNDPEVDVIYVATPHTVHREATNLCLRAGKAVLCEKPFAMNAAEAEDMVATSQETGKFLMEAMWPRFRPAMSDVRDVIASGTIGEIQLVTADLGWNNPYDPEHRLYNPELGGGALLDGGVYAISFASMLLGTPTTITGLAALVESGVDGTAVMALGYPNGALASLSVCVTGNPITTATIVGSKGRIAIDFWWSPKTVTVKVDGEGETVEDYTAEEGNGYQFEAMEVMRCLREGLIESPFLPHAEIVDVMRTMDDLRDQWGIRYPADAGFVS